MDKKLKDILDTAVTRRLSGLQFLRETEEKPPELSDDDIEEFYHLEIENNKKVIKSIVNIEYEIVRTFVICNNLNKYFKLKDISKIIFYMKQDKKNKDDKINLILLKSIGKPILEKSFSENNIRSSLKTLIY